eukprot:FR741357.1.p2 GENE.FR741357.1~~FR741357.1.p2  ORF type:complete len:132 (-),score=10.66 FR741357.1:456-851(-)
MGAAIFFFFFFSSLREAIFTRHIATQLLRPTSVFARSHRSAKHAARTTRHQRTEYNPRPGAHGPLAVINELAMCNSTPCHVAASDTLERAKHWTAFHVAQTICRPVCGPWCQVRLLCRLADTSVRRRRWRR